MNPKFTGALKSPEDQRDYRYCKVSPMNSVFPPKWSIKGDIPHINNQGSFGTCAAQAGTELRSTLMTGEYKEFSALFLYTICKMIDGIPDQEGTYGRSVMEALTKYGVCLEDLLPYSSLSSIKDLPSLSQTQKGNALNYRIKAYASVTRLDEIRTILLSGRGVMIAQGVTDTFFNPEPGGFMRVPSQNNCGGHMQIITGYDDSMTHKYLDGKTYVGFLEIPNSYGPEWGNVGYNYMPYAYILNNMLPWWEMWSALDDVKAQPCSQMVLRVGDDRVIVDGKHVVSDQVPYIDPKSNRTMVPLRLMAEHFGYEVDYSDGTIVINKIQ